MALLRVMIVLLLAIHAWAQPTTYTYTLGAFVDMPCFEGLADSDWVAQVEFEEMNIPVTWHEPGMAFFVDIEGETGLPIHFLLELNDGDHQIGTAWTIDNLNNGFNNFNLGGPFDFCNWEGVSSTPRSSTHPYSFAVSEIYPNPFNLSTRCQFEVFQPARVTMALCNVQGERVRMIMDQYLLPGQYQQKVDGSGLASGVYFLNMEAPDMKEVRKISLLK